MERFYKVHFRELLLRGEIVFDKLWFLNVLSITHQGRIRCVCAERRALYVLFVDTNATSHWFETLEEFLEYFNQIYIYTDFETSLQKNVFRSNWDKMCKCIEHWRVLAAFSDQYIYIQFDKRTNECKNQSYECNSIRLTVVSKCLWTLRLIGAIF